MESCRARGRQMQRLMRSMEHTTLQGDEVDGEGKTVEDICKLAKKWLN